MDFTVKSIGKLGYVAVALAFSLGGVPSAHAELDYEFAKALIERDQPSFSTDDLVERLVAQLDANPATKTDAKLIKATYKRRKANNFSDPVKALELLQEAETLYKEVTAAGPTYRLSAIAEKDSSSMGNEILQVRRNAVKNNPAELKKLSAEIAASYEKLANERKTAAEATYVKFKEVFARYQKFNEENGKLDEAKRKKMPDDLNKEIQKSFDEWVTADQLYVLARIQQLESYDDSDGAKKPLSEQMVAYTTAKLEQDDELIGGFPNISAWYYLMQGKAAAAVQNEEKAADAWGTVLAMEGQNLPDFQQRRLKDVMRSCVASLVKLKMKTKKYGDVEAYILEAKMNSILKTMFDEDAGKELIIDYAKALTITSDNSQDFEKAIKELRTQIQKETAKGTRTAWSNRFSRAMAEILEDARDKRGAMPRLSSQEWYDAAYGFYLMGEQINRIYLEHEKENPGSPKAKEEFEKAYEEFQNAVDYYRRAISVARNPDRTDLITRLQVEPKAWFEMGSCYLRMKHYYEAVVVFQAMRNTYMKDFRKKWLPDTSKPPYNKIAKQLDAALDELDKAKDGWLARADKTVIYALDENAKNHPDPWNKKLKPFVMETEKIEDVGSKVTDLDYTSGRLDMEAAKSFVDAGKQDKNAKTAEENYTQGVQKYLAAVERFKKVKPTSQGYELALYQIGSAYTQAQDLWAKGRFVSKPRAEQEAQSKDMAIKALEALDKYTDHITKTPTTNDDDKETRAKLEGVILLARNSLYAGTQEWDKVVKSSDDYVAWEVKNEQTKSSADIAYLNKYRALIELASKKQPPDCDQNLKDAEVALREFRKIKKTDNKAFTFMLDALSYRYNVAAAQAAKLKLAAEVIDAYNAKMADIQFQRVEMLEEEKEDVTLEDYSRLVYLFNRVGQKKRSADIAYKLLKKFDPENKNMIIPDDEAVWQGLLKKMEEVVKYDDLNKRDRCKRDHALLVDYMYDTRAGASLPVNDEKRPAYDKFNLDLEKALNQLNTIKKNYEDSYTLNDKHGENGKSYLRQVEEEIDFRRKIEAARDLLSDVALDVAEKLEKQGLADQAKTYRTIAHEQITELLKLRGETPQMQIKQTDIAISIGNLDEAVNGLREIRNKLDRESLLYFRASRNLSKVLAMQKNWRDAAEFPTFLVAMEALDTPRVKENWSDVREFLEECYKNGVPRPTGSVKKPEPKPEEPKTEPKTEPETNPKADPKAEAKPDEKKDATPPPQDK